MFQDLVEVDRLGLLPTLALLLAVSLGDGLGGLTGLLGSLSGSFGWHGVLVFTKSGIYVMTTESQIQIFGQSAAFYTAEMFHLVPPLTNQMEAASM